jgi:hypothetical protein
MPGRLVQHVGVDFSIETVLNIPSRRRQPRFPTMAIENMQNQPRTW